MDKEFIAHIGKLGDSWIIHSLIQHLQEVAKLAKRFAGNRGGSFVEQSALLHDLGKAQLRFKKYIQEASGFNDKINAHIEQLKTTIPHSTAGAKYVEKHFDSIIGVILAYLIAGHHAGLADWYDKKSLKKRLKETENELSESLKSGFPIQEFLLSEQLLVQDFPSFLAKNPNLLQEIHIWIRFLFSCLVDADFLDTEAAMKGYQNADEAKKHGIRPIFPTLDILQTRYQDFMKKLAQKAKNTPLQKIRADILNVCLLKAEDNHNIFSLTVPTGGGKTLASLGFALKHALKFNKKRIIYAIPFTSIIEQNAQIFRQAIGDDALIEHHSNLDINFEKETAAQRIAAENWDAPLIVTTNVQLFESLFASRTSRCRKIHNIVDSIIILDEAQQLPRDFQKPITDMMRVLARDYGVTFVLCTATQPELGSAKDVFGRELQKGLENIQEIIPNPNELAEKLKRVQIKFPKADNIRQSWQEIADEISKKDCVLAIVNTRNQAKKLFNSLPDHGIKLHLSANMCAVHRSEVIALVRLYLNAYRQGILNKPLWLISTQLIEAGVDLDFPVVYRQMSGLDSIAQAAGRCNREGKLTFGEVIVFRAEEGAPSGSLKQGQNITEEMLAIGALEQPLAPQTFKKYFELFNTKGDRDKYKICDLLTAPQPTPEAPLAINFCSAAEAFRMIDNNGITLIVPHTPWAENNNIIVSQDLDKFLSAHQEDFLAEGYTKDNKWTLTHSSNDDLPEPLESWFKALEKDEKNTWVYHKLQRYTITVPEHYLKTLPPKAIYERAGLLVLDNGHYSEIFGAIGLDDAVLPPENSVI